MTVIYWLTGYSVALALMLVWLIFYIYYRNGGNGE